ncbi:MAG: oligosaccharide flippase family protein [Bacteroidales bacterium]|nr:oligosaccharide flippase family protein [Bacteroidales bacterium]
MEILDTNEPTIPSLKKQSSYLLIGKVFSLVIKILAPIFLVRILTQKEYGIFQQFNLIVLTFIPILSMGLGSSLYYFFPTSEDEEKAIYIGQTYLLLTLMGIIFIIFYLFFGIRIHIFLGVEEINQYQTVIPIYVLFMLVSNLSNQLFTVEKRIRYNLLFFPADSILRTLLLVIFAFLYPKTTGSIIALFIYSLIRFLFITFDIVSQIKSSIRSINLLRIKKQFTYAIPFAGAIIIGSLNRRFDKLFVNKYISAEDFAIYSVAFFNIPIITEAIHSIQAVIVPELSSLYNSSRFNEMADLWKKAVTIVASINIPSIIYFYIIAEILFSIVYTDKYIDAASYFRLYIIVYVFFIFLRGVILRASNKTKYLFYIDLICFPIIIVSGYLLIRAFGIYGAVITAIIGEILPISLRLFVEIRILNLTILDWLEWGKLLRIVISSCIPLPIVYILIYYLSNDYLILLSTAVFYFFGVVVGQRLLGVLMFNKELRDFRSKILRKIGV